MKRSLFNWSGGKDSALALYHVLQDPTIKVTSLLTSVNEELGRISMHGVRRSLLDRQAEQLNLPLTVLSLPRELGMADYDSLMREKLHPLVAAGVTHSIFGDIFLEDLKRYREQRLSELGMHGIFPLWRRDTSELIEEFLKLGFRAVVVAVDGSKLDKSFAGRELDRTFINELPQDVDPCGENGEFHSFVFDGPVFAQPVNFTRGELVGRDYTLNQNSGDTMTYWFQDLVPVH